MQVHHKKILIVEDQPEIALLIREHLHESGYASEHVTTIAAAKRQLRERNYAAAIFDIGLPDGSGLDLCRSIRAAGSTLPILFLTCKDSESDRIVGLELGADDYLVKPFSARELTARVKALFRRQGWERDQELEKPLLTIGELSIDETRRAVKKGGATLTLTSTEFDLLHYLASRAGRPFSREQILSAVWQYDAGEYDHTVNTHVNRLRSKIEPDPAHPKYLLTVWGVGYRFVEPAELQ